MPQWILLEQWVGRGISGRERLTGCEDYRAEGAFQLADFAAMFNRRILTITKGLDDEHRLVTSIHSRKSKPNSPVEISQRVVQAGALEHGNEF